MAPRKTTSTRSVKPTKPTAPASRKRKAPTKSPAPKKQKKTSKRSTKPKQASPTVEQGLPTPPSSGPEQESVWLGVPEEKMKLSLQIPISTSSSSSSSTKRQNCLLIGPQPLSPILPPSPGPPLQPLAPPSTRLNSLLHSFPALSLHTPSLSDRTFPSVKTEVLGLQTLENNMSITESSFARKLAWQNFSSPEEGDRRRSAMVESGIDKEELKKERKGKKNTLPEWKKWRTRG